MSTSAQSTEPVHKHKDPALSSKHPLLLPPHPSPSLPSPSPFPDLRPLCAVCFVTVILFHLPGSCGENGPIMSPLISTPCACIPSSHPPRPGHSGPLLFSVSLSLCYFSFVPGLSALGLAPSVQPLCMPKACSDAARVTTLPCPISPTPLSKDQNH